MLVPTLTIPLRQVTAGSLPSGGSGIMAGGGSPGELQGSREMRVCSFLPSFLPSTQAARSRGSSVAALVRRCCTAGTSCAPQCSPQAERRSRPGTAHVARQAKRGHDCRCPPRKGVCLAELGSAFGPAYRGTCAHLSRWRLAVL